MNCNLYILENQDGKHYIGITKWDLGRRIEKHNRGEVYSTKLCKPWRLLYFEEYANYREARNREREIKKWHGGNSFKKLLRIAARSSNGRTPAFGAGYDGSNPSLAAMRRRKFGVVK